jgi:hypothetical protein
MLARRQFRHHPAVPGMKLNLTGNHLGQHPALVNDRGAGFIAGSLDCEEHNPLPESDDG